MGLLVDPERRRLTPPLKREEYEQLRGESTVRWLRDPLMVWSNGTPCSTAPAGAVVGND